MDVGGGGPDPLGHAWRLVGGLLGHGGFLGGVRFLPGASAVPHGGAWVGPAVEPRRRRPSREQLPQVSVAVGVLRRPQDVRGRPGGQAVAFACSRGVVFRIARFQLGAGLVLRLLRGHHGGHVVVQPRPVLHRAGQKLPAVHAVLDRSGLFAAVFGGVPGHLVGARQHDVVGDAAGAPHWHLFWGDHDFVCAALLAFEAKCPAVPQALSGVCGGLWRGVGGAVARVPQPQFFVDQRRGVGGGARHSCVARGPQTRPKIGHLPPDCLHRIFVVGDCLRLEGIWGVAPHAVDAVRHAGGEHRPARVVVDCPRRPHQPTQEGVVQGA